MEQDSSKPEHSQDLERFNQSEFVSKVENTNDLFLLKCPKDGNVHFRHAGYVYPMTPYVDPKRGAQVSSVQTPVMVCTTCKSVLFYFDSKFHDITSHTDLEAWDKTEKEMHKATGPGGDC